MLRSRKACNGLPVHQGQYLPGARFTCQRQMACRHPTASVLGLYGRHATEHACAVTTVNTSQSGCSRCQRALLLSNLQACAGPAAGSQAFRSTSMPPSAGP